MGYGAMLATSHRHPMLFRRSSSTIQPIRIRSLCPRKRDVPCTIPLIVIVPSCSALASPPSFRASPRATLDVAPPLHPRTRSTLARAKTVATPAQKNEREKRSGCKTRWRGTKVSARRFTAAQMARQGPETPGEPAPEAPSKLHQPSRKVRTKKHRHEARVEETKTEKSPGPIDRARQ